MHACKVQSIRLVNFLISQMKKIFISLEEVNSDNENALVVAVKTGNLQLIKVLVEKHGMRPFLPIVIFDCLIYSDSHRTC